MKRFNFATIPIILIILFSSIAAFAGDFMLDGVTTTGASSELKLKVGADKHVVSCHFTDVDLSITALTVALEGSIDPYSVAEGNAHWYQLASHAFTAGELTAKQCMFFVVNAPVKRVRVNITALTGGTASDPIYVLYNMEGD